MRFTKVLLQKPYDELTDEELKAIGKHFAKHPVKMPVKLHKCRTCKNLIFYDFLGEPLFECLHNPVNDLKTDGHKLIDLRKGGHWRKCDKWYDDNLPWPDEQEKNHR